MFKPITVKIPRPRNPWVAASYRSRAGSHRAGSARTRQRARRELSQALQQLDTDRPSP